MGWVRVPKSGSFYSQKISSASMRVQHFPKEVRAADLVGGEPAFSLQPSEDGQCLIERLVSIRLVLDNREPVQVNNEVRLSLCITGIRGGETANNRQRFRIDAASGGSVAEADLGVAQVIQSEPEIPLPLFVARVALR